MSAFDEAYKKLEGHEGGFVDNASDRGGATNKGFSLVYLKALGDEDRDGYLDGDLDHDGDVDVDDIRKVTDAAARQLALAGFWKKYRCDEIADARVAGKVFDLFFNMRPSVAGVVVQRALRACLKAIKEDGVVGTQTIAAINGVDPDRMLIGLRSEAGSVYRLIAGADATQRVFLNGWLNRAYS